MKNVALSALMGINGNTLHFIFKIPFESFLECLQKFSFLAATIFAYGQTSSGKTYTMRGITEKAVNDIYQHIMNVSLIALKILCNWIIYQIWTQVNTQLKNISKS